jgi:RND family efflux transporter MFP subunit
MKAWVVVAILAAAACRRDAAAIVDKPPRPVKIRPVEAIGRRGDLRYSATVETNDQVVVAFKVGGYIQQIKQARDRSGSTRDLDVGDTVRAGDELARIRQTDYNQAVNQVSAQLAEAEASVRKANEDFTRANTLFASQSATKPELDGARLQLESAQARQKAAQAAVAQAELTAADTAIRAPLAGVVLARRVEQGSLAVPGQAAFTIGSIARVKVVFGVPDTIVRQLRNGQKLSVTAEAVGTRPFTGEITTIAPAADPQSRVFSVELSLSNQAGALRPGMIATVTVPFLEGGPATVSAVPLTAIVKSPSAASPDAYAVFVAEGQGELRTARLRPVSLGDVFGNMIAVTSGLAVGTPVIVSGATLVTDGESLRVVQ